MHDYLPLTAGLATVWLQWVVIPGSSADEARGDLVWLRRRLRRLGNGRDARYADIDAGEQCVTGADDRHDGDAACEQREASHHTHLTATGLVGNGMVGVAALRRLAKHYRFLKRSTDSTPSESGGARGDGYAAASVPL
ncbi:MAG: hypothetical protein ACRD3Q_21985 [Terriglobales bacterium]